MTPDQEKALRAELEEAEESLQRERDENARLFQERADLRTALAAAQGALKEAREALRESFFFISSKHPLSLPVIKIIDHASATADAALAALDTSGKPGGEACKCGKVLLRPDVSGERHTDGSDHYRDQCSDIEGNAEPGVDALNPADLAVEQVERRDGMQSVRITHKPTCRYGVGVAKSLLKAKALALEDLRAKMAPAPPEGHPAPLVTCSTDTEAHHGPHHLRHPTRDEKSWCLDPVQVPGHPAPEGADKP